MGQKINPVSLRLQYTNRNFDNCWYTHYFYRKLINKDIFLQDYLNNFLKLLKLPTGRYSIHHFHKKTQIFNFFCDSKSTREWRTKLFGLEKKKNSLKKNRYFFKTSRNFKKRKKKATQFSFFFRTLNQLTLHKIQKKIVSFQNFQLWSTLQKTNFPSDYSMRKLSFFTLPGNFVNDLETSRFLLKKHTQNSFQNFTKFVILKKKSQPRLQNSSFLQIQENSDLAFLQNLFVYKILKSYLSYVKHKEINSFIKYNSDSLLNRILKSTEEKKFNNLEYKYKNYLQSKLSTFYNFQVDLLFFKVKNDWQYASYLADEIVFFLEKRIPFRRLKKRILGQLSQISSIRGVRISCSGRVGGKSKKAQRAKTECIKYGQTSLQVFSSKIDFSMKTAFTSFGSVGIKVWICYY